MKERQINTMMSAHASALLRRAAGGFEPSAADRTRARAAIARRLVIGAAAGAAVAAGAKSAAAAPSLAPAALAPAAVATTTVAPTALTTVASIGFATKFVAAVAIVGTVSAGAVTVHHVTRTSPRNARQNASTTSQIASQNAARALPQGPIANPIAMPIQATPIAVDDLPAAQTTPVAAPTSIANPLKITAIHDAPSQIASTENQKVTALQTGAEVELLQRAQQALQADDATRALALLNEHAQRFPNGTLAEERDAARVLALCGAGLQSEAAKMGAAFLSAHPDSPLASRVRGSCANGDAPAQ